MKKFERQIEEFGEVAYEKIQSSYNIPPDTAHLRGFCFEFSVHLADLISRKYPRLSVAAETRDSLTFDTNHTYLKLAGVQQEPIIIDGTWQQFPNILGLPVESDAPRIAIGTSQDVIDLVQSSGISLRDACALYSPNYYDFLAIPRSKSAVS